MQSEWLTLALAMVAVLGPVLTYVGTRRANAGSVETSDARALWDATDSLRQALTGQIDRLTTEVDRLGEENERLGHENRSLNEQVKQLTVEVQDLREQIAGRG